ncbi:hypothetical protein [Paenibacillus apis]|uniref:hypothetical protein n=1 Tax=Paenibacillus apis TaxID=1792174 RepID=UPI00265B424B|nr:hypothetical protein [Paenibacillus apis]
MITYLGSEALSPVSMYIKRPILQPVIMVRQIMTALNQFLDQLLNDMKYAPIVD